MNSISVHPIKMVHARANDSSAVTIRTACATLCHVRNVRQLLWPLRSPKFRTVIENRDHVQLHLCRPVTSLLPVSSILVVFAGALMPTGHPCQWLNLLLLPSHLTSPRRKEAAAAAAKPGALPAAWRTSASMMFRQTPKAPKDLTEKLAKAGQQHVLAGEFQRRPGLRTGRIEGRSIFF